MAIPTPDGGPADRSGPEIDTKKEKIKQINSNGRWRRARVDVWSDPSAASIARHDRA
jgi:hypothetical protein